MQFVWQLLYYINIYYILYDRIQALGTETDPSSLRLLMVIFNFLAASASFLRCSFLRVRRRPAIHNLALVGKFGDIDFWGVEAKNWGAGDVPQIRDGFGLGDPHDPIELSGGDCDQSSGRQSGKTCYGSNLYRLIQLPNVSYDGIQCAPFWFCHTLTHSVGSVN